MQKIKIVIFPHLAPFCQALSHMSLASNYKKHQFQIFLYSLFFKRIEWYEGWVLVNRFKHTSWATAVTPTDCPKSVRNSCVIKVLVAFLCCHVVFLDCSVGVGVFVTGLSLISSFFSCSSNQIFEKIHSGWTTIRLLTKSFLTIWSKCQQQYTYIFISMQLVVIHTAQNHISNWYKTN